MSQVVSALRKVESSVPPSGAVPVHAEEVGEFLTRVGVSSGDGLSDAEAKQRLAEHGKNRLPENKRKSAILRILEQFALEPAGHHRLAGFAQAIRAGPVGDDFDQHVPGVIVRERCARARQMFQNRLEAIAGHDLEAF